MTINSPIPEYKFGTAADYSGFDPNTTLTLCNVPWTNDYRDIVMFDGATPAERMAALDGYINGLPNIQTHVESTYARINAPMRIATPFAAANRFNYIRVKNAMAPFANDEPTAFYYFITDVQYVNRSTTQIVVQLDVWATFGYGVKFGRCYIDRSHLGIAATNSFHNYGRDHLMVPEGLDTGSDYRVINRKREVIMNVGATDDDNVSPNVLVLSTVKLDGANGTADNPSIEIAEPSTYAGVPVGMKAYILASIEDFTRLITALKDQPWVVEGIYSVSLIPPITRYKHYAGVAFTMNVNGTSISAVWPTGEPEVRKSKLWSGWRDAADLAAWIPARYRHLRKFFTFPYMMIEATTWNGSSLVIRPELWNDPDATVSERVSILPPGQRVTFTPMWYNAPQNGFLFDDDDDSGEHLSMAISLDSFITIPVMNNAGALALANNARGMAFERQSADWSQQRAQAGISTSYDQQSNAISTSTAQTELGNRTARQSTELANGMRGIGAAVGAVGGVVNGAVGGAVAGPMGAVAGAGAGLLGAPGAMLGAAMANHQASAQTGITTGAASESNRLANQSTAYVRDTNRDLAQFSARGDYQNQIAGMNARVQDTMMTQPSVKGNLGGDLMRAINDMTELSLRWKMLDIGAMNRIGEYWLRYGYAMNNFGTVPDGLHVMSHFTYWKLSETYIKSAPMPESYKHTIRGIFEKGVTVWRNPDDIGNIDIGINQPLEGITI